MIVADIATRAPACTSAGAFVVPGQRACGDELQRLRHATERFVPSATRQQWSGTTGEVQAPATARSIEGGSQCTGPFGACVGGSVASRFPRLRVYAAITRDSISVTSSGLQSPVHGFDSRLRLSVFGGRWPPSPALLSPGGTTPRTPGGGLRPQIPPPLLRSAETFLWVRLGRLAVLATRSCVSSLGARDIAQGSPGTDPTLSRSAIPAAAAGRARKSPLRLATSSSGRPPGHCRPVRAISWLAKSSI
jgi:hypothetical protein